MTEPIVIEPDSNELLMPSLHPMTRRRHRNNLRFSQFESESEESEHTDAKRKKTDKYPEKRKRRKTANKKSKKKIDKFRLCPLRKSPASFLHSKVSLTSLPAYKDPNQAPLLPFQESVSQEEKLSDYQFLLQNLDQQMSVVSEQQQQHKSNHNDQDVNLNSLVVISSENDSRKMKSKITKKAKKKKKKKFERIRRVPIRKPATDCHQIIEFKRMKILNQLSEQENFVEIVSPQTKIPFQFQFHREGPSGNITRQTLAQKSWEWKKQTIQFKNRSQNKSLLGNINS